MMSNGAWAVLKQLKRGGVWESLGEGRNVRAAINQEMVGPEVTVADRDEIAFFPPVTGG